MAALVIAWPSGQSISKKLKSSISKELHKGVYSEIVVVAFGNSEIPIKDIESLDLWDVCTKGKRVYLVQTLGYTWRDSENMIDSEDVYVCGKNTETQVLGVCLGLASTHNVYVIKDLCDSQSGKLNSRALHVVGASIGFANLVKTNEIQVDVMER